MRKTDEEYEGEDWCMLHDDTTPQEEFVWTEEELKAAEELSKRLLKEYKQSLRNRQKRMK